MANPAICNPALEIILPEESFARDREVNVRLKIRSAPKGIATLRIRWTDVHHRVVEDRVQELSLDTHCELTLPLDLRRARAAKNFLEAELTSSHLSIRTTAGFIAQPERSWRDWITIMWNPHDCVDLPLLKSLGIHAGHNTPNSVHPPEHLVEHDMRWYAESMAVEFYSPYHRWFLDRPKDDLMRRTKALFREDPGSQAALCRIPSLSDPVWLEKIHARGIRAAETNAPWSPLFYSLADEPGIAELGQYWDFDFSQHSLSNLRDWLKETYGTLDGLNRQWGTDFATWDDVLPDTTTRAMQREDGNWSSWADHKAWMDTEFARALEAGVKAIRTVDPAAYVGIGGAQAPGWGGYDYAKLTEVLNMFEPYNIGENVEVIRSLAPAAAIVTTSFESGPSEKRRVWHELLHGSRGLIIWDDAREFITGDGWINCRGADAAPYLHEMRSGIAALLMNSTKVNDPIAIHYSQSSMRTEWMKSHLGMHDAWAELDSTHDRRNSDFLRARSSWCRIVEDLGLQYRFVSGKCIENGALRSSGYRVLILPRSMSLSAQEVEQIRSFAELGGLVVSDVEPGTHDEHSREVIGSPLGGVPTFFDHDIVNYHHHRLRFQEQPARDALGALLRSHGIEPEHKLMGDDGRNVTGVELHVFRNGRVRILAMHSNPQWRVDELGPPEFRSNQRFETPASVRLVLPGAAHAIDVRSGSFLGRIGEWSGQIDPYEPLVLALFEDEVPKLRVKGPSRVSRGATANFGVSFAPRTPAALHVIHVETRSPAQQVVEHYSGNLLADLRNATYSIPFAMNDQLGTWTVALTDLLTGQKQTCRLELCR